MNHQRTGASPNDEVLPSGTVQERPRQLALPPILREEDATRQPLATVPSKPTGIPETSSSEVDPNEGSSALLRRKHMELVMPYGTDGTLRKAQTDWEIPAWVQALIILLVLAVCLLAVEAAFGWVGIVLKQGAKLFLWVLHLMRGSG